MKKSLGLLFVLVLVMACGPKKEKKKSFEYKRTTTEEKVKKEKAKETPINIANQGIGPIESMVFDADIDQTLADEGAGIFKQKCTACHMPDRKLIGPAVKGILNPTEMLQKDETAIALLKEYNNVMMLNQNLSKKEARALAEYFRTL